MKVLVGRVRRTRGFVTRLPGGSRYRALRNVEDVLHERGVDFSHETVRFWWHRFRPMFAGEIHRKRASRMRSFSRWQCHLDEVLKKIIEVPPLL